MKILAIVLLFATFALVQCSTGNPLNNIDNLPSRRIVLYKDVVPNSTLHEEIRSNQKGSESSRIVGGNEVPPHSLPHQAALHIDGQYFCGGSLISEDWVLTSALCLKGAKSVLVILGAHNLYESESTQQRFTSTKLIIHPNWDLSTLRNDVALIRLPSAAKLNANVSPACLVPSNIAIKDGTNVIASGWGKTSQNAPDVNTATLRSVINPTISNQKCGQTFIDFINDGMMCTDTSGGKGTCTGDNGGPLTISGRTVYGNPNKRQCQVGISSFVIDTCQNGYPAGFTRVSYHVDNFITKETGIQPCKECSGASVIIPSVIILLCSLVVLRFTNIF